MGEGLTDEKRHWCNERIPVSHRHIPITRRGALLMSLERAAFALRHRIKSDPKLLAMARRLRGMLARDTAADMAAAED
jgi:hypothetical protein